MGNIYEDDFNDDLMNIIKKKNKNLYDKLENDEIYLDWEGAVDIASREGNVIIKNYQEKVVGNISFRVKLSFDEFNEWMPEGIVEKSVKISLNKSNK